MLLVSNTSSSIQKLPKDTANLHKIQSWWIQRQKLNDLQIKTTKHPCSTHVSTSTEIYELTADHQRIWRPSVSFTIQTAQISLDLQILQVDWPLQSQSSKQPSPISQTVKCQLIYHFYQRFCTKLSLINFIHSKISKLCKILGKLHNLQFYRFK